MYEVHMIMFSQANSVTAQIPDVYIRYKSKPVPYIPRTLVVLP